MRPPNPTYVVPMGLAGELARAGVRHACIAPGSRSAPLAIALAAHGGFRVWTHVDERAAGFFALGLAKATRTPVAIACTSGSAAANLLPAVVEAHHARVPLLVLTADRPPELRDCGAPQTIDQHRLFGVHTRWFVEVDLPGDAAGERAARRIAARAAALAAGPPAGPVHLNVPLREPLAPEPRPTAPLEESGAIRVHAPRSLADPAAVAEVAATLERARRPLVVCGPLDDPDPMLPAAAATLAERLGAPVLAEAASNLRRPALDDLLVDGHDALARATAFADRHSPDAVLRLGTLPTSKPLAAWLARHSAVPQILLHGDAVWSDPDHVARVLLPGAPAATLAALADRVPATNAAPAWRDAWRAAGAAARQALSRAVTGPDGWFEGAAVAALAGALPPDATLYAGNSLAIRALDWFWPAGAPPVRVLANRGANGIDGFVSSVLGAAAGSGGPTVGLCGDLSFLHDAGGLLAAHRHGVRAVLVVLDNDGGGIFDHLPIAQHPAWFEALFVTPHGLDLEPLARAWGAGYARVHTAGDLAAAVRAALEAPRTTVVHAPIDRGRSLAAHRRAWRAAVAAAEAVA